MRASNSTRYGFTAQTIISSSYGLVNMMHPTFVALLRSLRVISLSSSAPSPQFIYDIPDNIGVNIPTFSNGVFSSGTASLNLSSLRLLRIALRQDGEIISNQSFNSFKTSYKDLFDEHNPDEKKKNVKVYGDSTVDLSERYLPKPEHCVISNGETC